MRKNGDTLGKWDLAHFQELISIYLSEEYPLKEWVLKKSGSLEKYEAWPRWLAKALDRVKRREFPTIARHIYLKMTNGQPNDVGFANMYLEGIETEIIDVLFLIHTHARVSIKEKYRESNPTGLPKQEMEIDMSNKIFEFIDGDFKVSGYPLYMLHKSGQPVDFETIVARLKERLRYS